MKFDIMPTPKQVFQPWGREPIGSEMHKQWLLSFLLECIKQHLSDPYTQHTFRTREKHNTWPESLNVVHTNQEATDYKLVFDKLKMIMGNYGWYLHNQPEGGRWRSETVLICPMSAKEDVLKFLSI